jgi:hypothetical protein
MRKDPYAELTDADFDRILTRLVIENAATLLTIPGVYEAVSEHFNNEILTTWEEEQAAKKES